MNIEKHAQAHISKDAKVRITTDGLVGNKIVVISGGSDDGAPIADNGYLQSEHRAGTEELMTTLAGQ